MSTSKAIFSCCGILCIAWLVIGSPLIVIKFIIKSQNPEFSVEQFYVPAFNKSANNATDNFISFNIKLENTDTRQGVRYSDSINVTFSYSSIHTNENYMWQYSAPKFYQGIGQSKRLVEEIQMTGGNVSGWNQSVVAEHSWIPAPRARMTLLQPLQFFRVNIIARVKFVFLGNSRGKELKVSALVPIDSYTGEMCTKDGIMMSRVQGIGSSASQVAVLAASTALSTIFICLITPFNVD